MGIHQQLRRRNTKTEESKSLNTTSANVIRMGGVAYNYMGTAKTLESAQLATADIRKKGYRATYRKRKEGVKVFQGPKLKIK